MWVPVYLYLFYFATKRMIFIPNGIPTHFKGENYKNIYYEISFMHKNLMKKMCSKLSNNKKKDFVLPLLETAHLETTKSSESLVYCEFY